MSSNLKSVGYDAATQTLEIEFKERTVYQYFNVPVRIFQGLMTASSKGGYHADHIKDRYRYHQIR